MFDSRAFAVKLGGTVLLVLAACVASDRWGELINPPYWKCLLEPDRYEGSALWFPAVTVKTAESDGFRFHQDSYDIRVRGRLPEGIGEGRLVGIRARFLRDGTLEASAVRAVPEHRPPRRWLNLVSLPALLVVIVLFLRAHRIRWDRAALRRIDG